MPRVTFVQPSASPHGCYRPGQTADVGDEAAAELVASGVAEWHERPSPAEAAESNAGDGPEIATIAPSRTAVTRTPKPRRPGGR